MIVAIASITTLTTALLVGYYQYTSSPTIINVNRLNDPLIRDISTFNTSRLRKIEPTVAAKYRTELELALERKFKDLRSLE